jgi:hypothetical protein
MARKIASKNSPRKQSKNKRKKARRKNKPAVKNKHDFSAAFGWFFGTGNMFSHLKFHGNTGWGALELAMQALIFSWSEKDFVTDAFSESHKRCQQLKHAATVATYQGFMRALASSLGILMPLMLLRLQELMEEVGGQFWLVEGYVPLAFDGGRSDASRTVSNESEFCAPNHGKGKTAKYRKKKTKGMRRTQNEKNKPVDPKPQAWITMMWHMGLRMPWSWRLGPSNSSERRHVCEMLAEEKFPENTLFCGDAGFVGYDFWKWILGQGHDFVVRVGGNVSLLYQNMDFERRNDGTVFCWPLGKQAKERPLILRLVQIKVGSADMYLLTSVLDSKRLSRKKLGKLYEMRWGIEVEFRGLKQTLKKSKLRCRNAQRLYAELSWSILAMAVAELLALKEQIPAAQSTEPDERPYKPQCLSLANTMRAIYECLDNLNEVVEDDHGLNDQLRKAVTDRYTRKAKKAARYRPKNPDKKKLGNPTIRKFTVDETEKMKRHEYKNAA